MSELAGSHIKAARAHSVVSEFEAELGRFIASTPYTLSGTFDPVAEEWVVLVRSAADPPLLLRAVAEIMDPHRVGHDRADALARIE